MSKSESDTVELARQAFAWLDAERDWTTGIAHELQQRYFELLADDVVLDVDGTHDDAIFGDPLVGKRAVVNMYKQAPDWIEGNCLERPLEFVGSGDRVVVLGAERFTIKSSGVTARNKEFAIVLNFREGLIMRVRQIGDMSEWIDARRAANVALARRAYGDLVEHRDAQRQSSDFQPYIDLLAEDVVFGYAAPPGTPVSEVLRGKAAVVEFMTTTSTALVDDISLDRPLEFFGNGDRVVVLGSESYTIKKTGAPATNKEFAVVMDFRDGRIVRVLQIKDLSDFVQAYQGG